MLQTSLIEKVLAIANMTDCNGVATPTGPNPVGSDSDAAEDRGK